MEKKLSEMKPGQKGVIKELGNQEAYIKLMEMGCVPGEEVMLEQVAPLGDPITILVAGYMLSLRRDEASLITVTLNN